MAAAMAGVLASPVNQWRLCLSTRILGPNRKRATNFICRSGVGSRVSARTGGLEREGKLGKNSNGSEKMDPGVDEEGDCEVSVSMEDYIKQAVVLVKLTGDGGGPRWFSPVECGRPVLKNTPLLLYLPGIDGIGLGLLRQHRKLGRIFETWCMHIPVMDRTSFAGLVNIVEAVIKSEHSRSSRRPIYLVGESFGGCLALAVASRNADIDLVLVLANPATSFNKSPFHLLTTTQFQLVLSLLEATLSRGDFTGLLVNVIERFLGQSQVTKDLLHGLHSLSSYYCVIANIIPMKTFTWKMEMLRTACDHANSRLHGIRAQTLLLTSGMDPLLPSLQEGERLRGVLPNCEIRKFYDKGHFLFLEGGADLVYTIKGASFYRRARFHDCASDYLPPTPSEFKRFRDRYWWLTSVASPVVLSTLEDGTIVRGLEGVPSDGPTLLVGYHMLMGFELTPLLTSFLAEKNILVRGLAHPMMFKQPNEKLPDLSELMRFELMHILMGAVPVSSTNFFKLLASKSHVLLYPGGAREALHRKGEEYQLFWPEESEFVRMAARFGANIVPFGAVGEDDLGQFVLDYNDLKRIPYINEAFETLTNELVKLRTESSGEVSNQQFYIPGVVPKVPGRLYYLFGKPIRTQGRRKLVQDKENAHEVYMEVKCEVERCLAYLKEKREDDPYRSLLARIVYLSTHNNTSQLPTFKL